MAVLTATLNVTAFGVMILYMIVTSLYLVVVICFKSYLQGMNYQLAPSP